MSIAQRPIVLLVEDSEDDAFFFRHTLKKAGLPCRLVHLDDGGRTLSYLKSALGRSADPDHPRPDLVFLDLKLPTLSGFDILQWLRAEKPEPGLDITVLSGSEHASDIERASRLGASHYLVKPVLAEQLRGRFAAWEAMHPASTPPTERLASRA